jgi:hypothetical protein
MKRTTLLVGGATLVMASVLATTAAHGDVTSEGTSEPAPTARYIPGKDANSTASSAFALGLTADSPTADVMPTVADRIYNLGADRGFSGQQTNYDKRAIAVRWKGAPPKDIAEYLASSPYGVTISVITDAKYSRTELEAARTRLLNSPQGTGIVWTALNKDGSGFRVGVTEDQSKAATRTAGFRATAGINDVETVGGAKPIEGWSRPNDAPAWKGGARTRHPGGVCSTGFAVLRSSGAGRLLSAGHCDTSGDGFVHDGTGQEIAPGNGQVSFLAARDSLLIDPTASPATQAKIYRGAYNSNTTSTVKSSAWSWDGDPVCFGGATNGERCGYVYEDVMTVYIHNLHVPVVAASNVPNIIGGAGDSGGPVFATVSGGVQARGIILGPDLRDGRYEQYNCPGQNPADAGAPCGQWGLFVEIPQILGQWYDGLTLETG